MDVGQGRRGVQGGKVEYRTDRTAIVHMTVGKTSFPDEHLLDNYRAILEEIIRAKPSAAKGKYIRTVTMRRPWAPASRSIRRDQGLGRDGGGAAAVARSSAVSSETPAASGVRPG
jgi:large subunit ribosomal protein L1